MGGDRMADPLRQAVAAVQAGDRAAGRRLLAEVIRGDPRNETAWLWMSAVTDSDAQRRACLERVLAINPANPAAQQGLARLRRRQERPSTPGPAVPQAAQPILPLPESPAKTAGPPDRG